MPIFHHLYSKWPRIIIRLPREKMHRRDRDRVGRGGEEWRKWRHGGDIGRSVNGNVWLPVLNKNYAADYSPFRSSPHSSSSRHARVSIAVARCVRILVYLHPSISRALGSSTLPEIKRGYPTHTHTHTHLPSLHARERCTFQRVFQRQPIHAATMRRILRRIG